LEGALDEAGALLDEADAISLAIGAAEQLSFGRLPFTGLRGIELDAISVLKAAEESVTAGGEHVYLTLAEQTQAVLYNGLGRYEIALTAAQSASQRDELLASVWSLPELVEAATRCGKDDIAKEALESLGLRTGAAGTDLALGIEARSRALTSEGPAVERLYGEAIDRLERTRMAVDLARAHLLFGEWLRRSRRRLEARDHLRRAQEMFASMGARAFEARAGRELLATGETARKRTDETRDELTAQELQIAQLARDGLSNPEIGARLFISPRTVEYHLRKVFAKLGISSRAHLDRALPPH